MKSRSAPGAQPGGIDLAAYAALRFFAFDAGLRAAVLRAGFFAFRAADFFVILAIVSLSRLRVRIISNKKIMSKFVQFVDR